MQDRPGYYVAGLAAKRLRECYQCATPRVRRYLAAEIAHVAERIRSTDKVLELGCGYGRALEVLAPSCELLVGIDSSQSSIELASSMLMGLSNCRVLVMDAGSTGFRNGAFDVVACIQNGLSAFKIEPHVLIRECVRITRPGRTVLLSTYAEGFWEDRLEWFELQAERGLIGEIDRELTGKGVIVCKDGFKSTSFRPDELAASCSLLGIHPLIEEVDGSSLFCEILVESSHSGSRKRDCS